MSEIILSILAIIFVIIATVGLIIGYRNRALIEARKKKGVLIGYSTANLYLRVGIFYVLGCYIFILTWSSISTKIAFLFLDFTFMILGIYLVTYRPTFKYGAEQLVYITDYELFDKQNKMFLLVTGKVSLAFSIIIGILIGVKYIF